MNLITLTSIILTSLCILPAYAGKPPSKVLKVGMTQEFENLNPLVMSMLATSYIYRMVGRTLVVLDENGKWVPQLAKKIPTLENGGAHFIGKGKDRKIKFVWELRDTARWGDGTPITCEDIRFSWNVAKSDNISIPDRETYDQVREILIDKTNPRKCTFVSKPKWDYNHQPTFYIIPKHIEHSTFKKFNAEVAGYEKNSKFSTAPSTPGLYSGPFRISDIKLGSHVTLVRNKYFYGEQAKFDKIILRLIPNTGTLEANIRSGTIDMISVLGMTFDQALAFEKKVKLEKLPFKVHFKPSSVYEHIDLKVTNEKLKDLRVRKALVHGINRSELTDALFQGRQIPALHNVAPVDPWFTNDPGKIKTYSYSRRKARKLLEKAGWKVGKNGIRQKAKQKLSFTLMTTSGNKVRELVQVFLKDQWKQIGIDIKIKNEPARVFFSESVRKRKYDSMAMYSFVSAPETSPRPTLHSESIPTKKNNFSGQNRPGWKNKQVDLLINQLDQEFDFKKRIKLVHKILYFYTEEVPVIPLYYRSDVAITPMNMTGYQLTGHQFTPANHVERWQIK